MERSKLIPVYEKQTCIDKTREEQKQETHAVDKKFTLHSSKKENKDKEEHG